MTIPVSCPSCGKVLHAKESAAGKKAKCPDCGDIIRIPELDELEDAVDDAVDAEEVDSEFNDFDLGDEEASMPKTASRKPCPACGEMIVKGAAKCRFCGEILDPKLKKLEKKRSGRSNGGASGSDELSTADWFLIVLCPGIACILGVIRMIQGNPTGGKMIGYSFLFSFLIRGGLALIGALIEGAKP